MTVKTTESLRVALKKSKLLSEKQLAEVDEIAGRKPDARALAKSLVRRKLLTPWQAGQLLAGRISFHLGKYKLIDLLGRGGMGSVFYGKHTRMNRPVALKIFAKDLADDADGMERFLTEARAMAALDHPNIVHAYNVEQAGDRYYLVMEYVEGSDLQRLVETEGPLDYRRAADCIRQTADGLAHAHSRDMIHRDVKPGNLLLGGQDVIKILDLGIARVGRSSETETTDGKFVGTVDYLAPEQASNSTDLDHRVDIYSLGCTFYFLLTGQPPFPKGSVHELLIKHQSEEPASLFSLRRDVPKVLVKICEKMMAKEPDERFQSAGKVSVALQAWLARTSPKEATNSVPDQTGARKKPKTASKADQATRSTRPSGGTGDIVIETGKPARAKSEERTGFPGIEVDRADPGSDDDDEDTQTEFPGLKIAPAVGVAAGTGRHGTGARKKNKEKKSAKEDANQKKADVSQKKGESPKPGSAGGKAAKARKGKSVAVAAENGGSADKGSLVWADPVSPKSADAKSAGAESPDAKPDDSVSSKADESNDAGARRKKLLLWGGIAGGVLLLLAVNAILLILFLPDNSKPTDNGDSPTIAQQEDEDGTEPDDPPTGTDPDAPDGDGSDSGVDTGLDSLGDLFGTGINKPEQSPDNTTPDEEPPADTTPDEEPPADTTPDEEPPADTTPDEEPPADTTPDEEPPAEKPPAEKPPAEKPPAEKPPAPKKPPKNPYAQLPAVWPLPEYDDEAEQHEAVDIGSLAIDAKQPCYLALCAGGEGLKSNTRQQRKYLLSEHEGEGPTASWLVELEETTTDQQPEKTSLARIRREGVALKFQWEPGIEKSIEQYLGNCLLEVRVPPHKPHRLALREVVEVEPPKLALGRKAAAATIDARFLPADDHVRVRIVKVNGLDGMKIEPRVAPLGTPMMLKMEYTDGNGNTNSSIDFRFICAKRTTSLSATLAYAPSPNSPQVANIFQQWQVDVVRNQTRIMIDQEIVKIKKRLEAKGNKALSNPDRRVAEQLLVKGATTLWYLDTYEKLIQDVSLHFQVEAVLDEASDQPLILARTIGCPAP